MIDWLDSWDAALGASGESGKPVFLFLFAVG
jgi:hypothetical protein